MAHVEDTSLGGISMRDEYRGARTQYASGRFPWTLALVLLAAGCQTVEGVGDGTAPAPPAPEAVVLEPGPISEADEAAARALLDDARRSFAARRMFEVVRTVDEVVERYPASTVSGDALLLGARAQLEIGDFEAADSIGEVYIGLLPDGDPRIGGVRIVQAMALQNDRARGLERLLQVPPDASPDEIVMAVEMARVHADSLDNEVLQPVLDSAPVDSPLRPVLEARLAVGLLEMNQPEAARLYAQRALTGSVTGVEREWAEGVLAGVLPEGRDRTTSFRLGVVLPVGGPPALAEFSQLVVEGIQVAVATVLGEQYEVQVELVDDEGDPERTAQAIARLEADSVHGIVGMLQDEDLIVASEARTTAVPIVSPTARSAARAGGSVYSLEGAGLEAATSLIGYAATRAYQRIAIVHPQSPEAVAEADAFEQAARAFGMPVVGRYAYEAGATFFEPQILAARDALRSQEIARMGLVEDDTLQVELLEPAAIFLPIPPEDVEFVAPQLIHFGLDTLAIEILGTTGWTDPAALQAIDTRHTNGVVATAAVGSAPESEGRAAFRAAYEDFFRRSLVGSAPAIGYDATLLLLEALRPGRVAHAQLERAFEAIEGVEGATGVFSVVDGRVVRRTEVVRIENRQTIPLGVADSADAGGEQRN